MKKLTLAAAAAALLAASSANASVLFSDTLQGSLATSNWVANYSGEIVTAPGGGKAMHFTTVRGGYDLLSKTIASTPGTYTVQFDYYCAKAPGAGGCSAFVGLYGGAATTPGAGDGWMMTDTPEAFGTPFTMSSNGAWKTVSFSVDVLSSTPFAVKLEDYSGGGNVAGDAYFRNLSVSSGAAPAVPEPATWAMMIAGMGVVGAALRRRESRRAFA